MSPEVRIENLKSLGLYSKTMPKRNTHTHKQRRKGMFVLVVERERDV